MPLLPDNSSTFPRKGISFNSGSLIMLLSWLSMQIFIFYKLGIETEGESAKYIYEAKRLLAGEGLTSNNFLFYIVTILLISLSLKLKIGFFIPIVVQLVLNLIATITFYKWITINFGRLCGLTAAVALIICLPYQEFNAFLQTESIFFSLIIILSCYAFSIQKLEGPQLLSLSALLVALTFTRPSGILFVPVTFCYIYFRFITYYNSRLKTAIGLATAGLSLLSLESIMSSGGELNFLLPFVQQHVICGVPTVDGPVPVADATETTLSTLLNYVTHHSAIVLDLAKRRTVAFFGVKRVYYCTLHNSFVTTLFFILYTLSLSSLLGWLTKNKPILLYLLSAIGITWVTTMLTCDDWHNRFILSVYPMFILLSLPIFKRLVYRFTKSS